MRRLLTTTFLLLVLLVAGCGGDDDETTADNATATPTATATPAETATETPTPEDTGGEQGTGCKPADKPAPKSAKLAKPSEKLDPAKTYVATVKTNCGTFEITLDAKQAPKTGGSFKYLADKGFYDGLSFHRVVGGFVIQGGDPRGDGTGGPGYSVVEAPPDGIVYKKGTVAMAKTQLEDAGHLGQPVLRRDQRPGRHRAHARLRAGRPGHEGDRRRRPDRHRARVLRRAADLSRS